MHAGGDGALEEPNLVPLLDLVLQMVMFFMACTNFAMANANAAVVLPLAQSARPVEDTGDDILYLNIDEKGNLLITRNDNDVLTKGEVTLNSEALIRAFINREFEDRKQKAQKKNQTVQTIVILRAHKDANFADVYKVMRACRGVGFRKMQLRAIKGVGR
jgi:biopolymer transport protein ExbD